MKCQYNCGFFSFRAHNLRKHEIMSHETVGNGYKCEYCGYATNRKDCFNRHNETLMHNHNVAHNAKNGVVEYIESTTDSSSNSLLDSLRPPSIVRTVPIMNGPPRNPLVKRPKRITPQYMQYLAIAQQFQQPVPIFTQPIYNTHAETTFKPLKTKEPTTKFEHLPIFSKVDAECPACTFKTPCKFTLKSHLVENHEDYLIKEYNLNFDYRKA